jgi:transcriptional regulator with XRE-family HTH domain
MNGRARIAWNLRRARTSVRLTQEVLAFEAKVDPSTVNEIENAKFNASVDLLERLANACKIDLADLFAIPPADELPPPKLSAGRKPAAKTSRSKG